MAFKLPRLQLQFPIVDANGYATAQFQADWNLFARAIETQETRQDELIAALETAVAAIQAAQDAADAANAAAAAAQAAADAAETEALAAAAAADSANAAITTIDTTLADHETRIDALEP